LLTSRPAAVGTSARIVPASLTLDLRPIAMPLYCRLIVALLAVVITPTWTSTAVAQPRPAAKNLLPAAPFNLNAAQQQLLDQVLLRWEKQSGKVSTYLCDFRRWEIDPTFAKKAPNNTLSESEGAIRYKAPDRGEYEIEKVMRWDQAKAAYVADESALERWMCDGVNIYEWDRKNKQLKVRPLPDDLKGKAIADGPLPFVFGAKAAQLKRRYWMRDVTPREQVGKQIWLEARPKFQQDATNFQRATVVLDEKTFLPVALQLFPPGIAPVAGKGQAYTAYQFMNPSVNNPLDKLSFLPPIAPPFWKKVVVQPPVAQGGRPVPPAGEPAEAKRRGLPAPRK